VRRRHVGAIEGRRAAAHLRGQHAHTGSGHVDGAAKVTEGCQAIVLADGRYCVDVGILSSGW
jgi:hypothetical protein